MYLHVLCSICMYIQLMYLKLIGAVSSAHVHVYPWEKFRYPITARSNFKY